MRRGLMGGGLILLALACHGGDIYVCRGDHGEKVYQNAPCATPAKQVGHSKYSDELARAPVPPPVSYTDAPTALAAAPRMRPAAPVAAPVPPVSSHGLDSSAFQSGAVQAMKCVTIRGKVYYVRGACGVSTTTIDTDSDEWRKDQVDGVPGAVMVAPDQALNPMTGQMVQLQARAADFPVVIRHQDQGVPVDPDEACREARKAADGKFSQLLDRRARELCDDGRSLYDQPSSAGIP